MGALLAILRLGLRSLPAPRVASVTSVTSVTSGAPVTSASSVTSVTSPPPGASALTGVFRLAVVVALSTLSGALAGLLPSVVGVALGAVTGGVEGRRAPPVGGLSAAVAHLLAAAQGAPTLVVLAAVFATLASAFTSVLASRKGTELAGDLTAALRIEMFRAALFASPRVVEAAGREILSAQAAKAPPRPADPAGRAPLPPVRGTEVVKLAIARDAGLVADFGVAFLTGLPQAIVTLSVLAVELVASGTALVLLGGVALFALSRLASDRASRLVAGVMREMQHADTAVFGALGEALAGAEDLRLLGARGQAVGEVSAAAYRVAAARRRFGQALAVSGQIKGVFVALAPLVIVASIALSRGDAGAGEVGKLLLVIPLLLARLEALDALRAGFIERGPVLHATLALLRLPEHPPRDPAAPLSDPGATSSDEPRRPAAIAFERVSFTPPGASGPILDDVSLSIPPGAVVGVCGRSGCGKSTLVRLLLRLDEPSSGAITVDGADLRGLAPDRLPRVFGVVGQASRLFERSVGANLTLGLDPPPPDDRLREALRRVELDAFAGARSDDRAAAPGQDRGLATEVRSSPPSLSGGEARRMLLARTLLREPRIFVLDEPEAGLPSATAEALLRTVGEVAAGRTAIVVTHAPHLLRSTFNVLLDAGRVAAIGTHEELSAGSALYRSLLAEALKPSVEPRPPSSLAPAPRPGPAGSSPG